MPAHVLTRCGSAPLPTVEELVFDLDVPDPPADPASPDILRRRPRMPSKKQSKKVKRITQRGDAFKFGKLGAASPVRHIDPKTGEVIKPQPTKPARSAPWTTERQNIAEDGFGSQRRLPGCRDRAWELGRQERLGDRQERDVERACLGPRGPKA
jgi:hypothetical protein